MKGTIILLFISLLSIAQAIPYTLGDRNRAINQSEQLKSLEDKMNLKFEALEARFSSIDTKFEAINTKFEAMNSKFESIQKQLDFTNNLILVLLASIIGSVAYMWWDRNRANSPIISSLDAEKRKVAALTNILKDFSKTNPELKAIFDKAAIL